MSQAITKQDGPQAVQMSMADVMHAAVEQNMQPETIGKMLDVVERMQANEARQKYADAIAAFQSECPPIKKSRRGHNSDFASYDDVMKVAGPVMAKHGIAVEFSQDVVEAGTIKMSIEVSVGPHSKTQTSFVPVPKEMKVNDTQKFGAALSYGKRYLLCMALNIVTTDEDTDAANLSDTITAEQADEISLMLDDTGADVPKFLKWAKAATVPEIPAEKYATAIQMLRAKGSKQ